MERKLLDDLQLNESAPRNNNMRAPLSLDRTPNHLVFNSMTIYLSSSSPYRPLRSNRNTPLLFLIVFTTN